MFSFLDHLGGWSAIRYKNVVSVQKNAKKWLRIDGVVFSIVDHFENLLWSPMHFENTSPMHFENTSPMHFENPNISATQVN